MDYFFVGIYKIGKNYDRISLNLGYITNKKNIDIF